MVQLLRDLLRFVTNPAEFYSRPHRAAARGGPSSTVEGWGRLRSQTGLNPLRPKPSDAVALVWEVLRTCSACEGVGYRHGFGGSRLCTACDGRGTLPGLSDPRVQAVLRSIEARCPGAVAPGVIVPVAPDVTPAKLNED